MGKQIYETFLPSEVTEVTIMMQKAVNNYDLEMWENLGGLQAVFEDLATKNARVTVSTITPFDRLGITFHIDTERIRSVAQLYKFSMPGRIIPADTTRVI